MRRRAERSCGRSTRREYCADFRAAFAANLGVTEAEMTAAARKAAISTIDKAVADGDMTKAAGDRLKARIEAAPAEGVRCSPACAQRPPRPSASSRTVWSAAADALKMTPAELAGRAARGQVAQGRRRRARNVPYATVCDAIVAAVKADLDAAVKAGTLKQARADRILERLETRLADGQLRPARPAASPATGRLSARAAMARPVRCARGPAPPLQHPARCHARPSSAEICMRVLLSRRFSTGIERRRTTRICIAMHEPPEARSTNAPKAP